MPEEKEKIEDLRMKCSDNEGFIIDFMKRTPNEHNPLDYSCNYKTEVFTKWSEASKRFKELADQSAYKNPE